MKPTTFVSVYLVIFIGLAGSGVAQDISPVKNWEPLAGHWVNEEQQLESPDGDWQQLSSEWHIQMMPEGFFVEIPGIMKYPDGREVSWIQVWGHDSVKQVAYHHWFTSIGSHGEGTWEFSGTVQSGGATETFLDGAVQTTRCEWRASADYKTSNGSCERPADDGERTPRARCGPWNEVEKPDGKVMDSGSLQLRLKSLVLAILRHPIVCDR